MGKIIVIKGRTASHEVDPQKGFTPLCPTELPVPDGHNIAKELNRQAQFAKYRTVSKDVHPSNAIWLASATIPQFVALNITDEPNVDQAWNAHCMSGTEGAELIPGLPKITHYNFIVYKGIEPNMHPYSGVFHDANKKISTGLAEFYTHYDIDTIIVGGLALDYCVKDTVIDLCRCGFGVIVNLAATRAIGDVQDAIVAMQRHGAVIIQSLDELQPIEVSNERIVSLQEKSGASKALVLSVLKILPNGNDDEVIQFIHTTQAQC